MLSEKFRTAEGDGFRSRTDVFSELLETLPWLIKPEVNDLQKYWDEVFPKCTELFDGVPNLLQALKKMGFKLGIITNGGELMQNGKIDNSGIRKYMSSIIISETAGVKKPGKEIFQLALNHLQLNNDEVCYVGDDLNIDVFGAFDSGIIPVWISDITIWPVELDIEKYIISNTLELKEIIHKIVKRSLNGN